MAREDLLDRLFRAWREEIDSEPFPVIADVVLPVQTRRHMRGEYGGPDDRPGADSTPAGGAEPRR
ncbi:hypothetical protein [Qaidamihabitans albus]|uniref:hypothetical protein n=1 Tax=Qaidamihabitans albus TaxID=2795733 RepID=UPI0018F24883|nr:hypothetical protein [Qaidamihabitans albus]